MDVLLQFCRLVVLLVSSLGFNPCFNGCASSIILVRPEQYNKKVSILVLMDVLLQSKAFTKFNAYQLGFNPCFNGCASSM